MNEKISTQVALVLDKTFGEGELLSLRERMPVWILEDVINRVALEAFRKIEHQFSITTFSMQKHESAAKACERIIQSLDDHYNEYSQEPAYDELRVIGVSLGDLSLKPFLVLNFNQFFRTPEGFIAKKKKGLTCS